MLAGSLGGICLLFLNPVSPAQVAEVEENGRLVARLPLSENCLLHVLGRLGTTDVCVQNHGVAIVRSPCPQRVCVMSGRISRSGQMTACVPNRIVVRITGGEPADVDAVSR